MPRPGSSPATRVYGKIYAVVRRIPRGKVATYGQVARLAGLPRHARQVGYALSALTGEKEIPWQRVINTKGEISRRAVPFFEERQYVLLRQEGIRFTKGRVSMKRYQWETL